MRKRIIRRDDTSRRSKANPRPAPNEKRDWGHKEIGEVRVMEMGFKT